MTTLLVSIIVSLCLGALVGLIRQWSDQTAPEGSVDLGGVRTYSLWAILGCLGAYLGDTAAPALLTATFALVGVHQIVAMAKMPPSNRPGGTTFASVLLTVLVGALVYWHNYQAAILVAATTAVLLGLKQHLHAWTRRFTAADIWATLQFVAITGVILPIVPNQNFGPYAAFNPYRTWLLVVLISGLGFLGYIAMRALGTRAGLIVTSLFGGLASSTATTLAFSRRSKTDPTLSEHYTLAVVIACSVMLARVIITVGVLNLELALNLVVPLALMALPGVIYGAWLWFKRLPGKGSVAALQISNPLSLKTAIKFALLYTVIGFIVKALSSMNLLNSSLLPLSFFSGLTDMDAISLSVTGSRSSGAISLPLATQAILIAAVSSSLIKAGFAISLGSPQLRREISIVLGLTALVGAAACWYV
ncbi:MAG: MgtC/SapB family protein [Opitutaceae bacterium]